MITVNLKAVAGILGGAATVTVLITSAIKVFRSEKDNTNRECVQPEPADETADGLTYMDDSMENVSIDEEISAAVDSVSSYVGNDATCCTSCLHGTYFGEKPEDNLKKHSGYNNVGVDPAGHSPRYYVQMIRKLRVRLNDACRQINGGELRYAVYDTRTVMDETLRMVVNHSDGSTGNEQSMIDNLVTCENRHLISGNKEFFSRLHRIRIMCNTNGHRIDAEKTETGNKVCSAITMIHELINRAEAVLVPA